MAIGDEKLTTLRRQKAHAVHPWDKWRSCFSLQFAYIPYLMYNSLMDKKQITIKIWTETYKLILKIKAQTNEPIVLVVHRLVMAEIKRLKIK